MNTLLSQLSSAMELARPRSNFQSDLDFCPDCGSILPLPGAQDAVICPRCGFSIDVRGEELVCSAKGTVEGSTVGVTSVLVGLREVSPRTAICQRETLG